MKINRWALTLSSIAVCAYLYNTMLGRYLFWLPPAAGVLWDGGYRVLLGQVPLRDFYSAVGPVSFWFEALIFKLFGVSFMSFLLSESLANALCSCLAGAIAWRLLREPIGTLACGLLTCLWIGKRYVPTYDTISYLSIFTSLALIVQKTPLEGLRAFSSGILLGLAFYSKQSNGVAGLALALYLLEIGDRRGALLFLAGFSSLIATGFLYYWSVGCWSDFLRQLFILPMGWKKLHFTFLELATAAGLIYGAGLPYFRKREPLLWAGASLGLAAELLGSLRMEMVGTLLGPYLPLGALAFLKDKEDRALLMSLTLFQAIAGLMGRSDRYWPFLGILLALAWRGLRTTQLPWLRSRSEPLMLSGLAFLALNGLRSPLALTSLTSWWTVLPWTEPLIAMGEAALAVILIREGFRRRRAWAAAGLALLALSFLHGARAERRVRYQLQSVQNPSERGLTPDYAMNEPGLRGLYLAASEGVPLEQAIRALRGLPAIRRPFFVYPDDTYFYSLVGQPSPQPYLWFDRGLTYLPGDPDEPRICGALRKNNVRTILVNLVLMHDRLEVPCVEHWLVADFRPVMTMGDYRLYYRNEKTLPDRVPG